LRRCKDDARHVFVRGDIGDPALVGELLAQHRPRAIVNFAAETHVDASIHGPAPFIETNVAGPSGCSKRCGRAGRTLPKKMRARSASSTSRPTRSMARWARTILRFTENDGVRAEQPVLGVEGGRRPSGARLSSHVRIADAHDQLLEQLRPLQFPEKLIR
jgi:hypothetical protein